LLFGIQKIAKDSPEAPTDEGTFHRLEEGDFLVTTGAYYDTAGHIIHEPAYDDEGKIIPGTGKYKTYYKLPKST
jgi:hypothetical protein